MTIRLAVNVRALAPDRIGGLEGCFRQVFDRLVRERRDTLAVTLLTSSWNDESFGSWDGLVSRRCTALDQRALLLETLRDGFDLLYCPLMFLEPEAPPIPSVVAIPDLQHQTYPRFFAPDLLAQRLRSLRIGASRARRIITLSEFSRREIVSSFHLPPERVVVTSLDSAPEFRRARDDGRRAQLRSRLRLPERWLLYPANDWPHKNHRLLFRALRRYRERFGAPPALLLTGARVGGSDLEAEARQEGVAELVRHLGWIPAEEMPDLYDGAVCVPFLSLFEGFGMPIVEAMRRGVPVVASNRTSLPEVTGGHALLVEPDDPEAIAEALHRTLTRSEECADRVSAARRWVERYSFERAAEQTLGVLVDAVRAPEIRLGLAVTVEPPSVHVVTPSFQQAAFLRETIDSVLGQEYPRLDYFVADGGSTDGSVEILRSYGERLRWRSAPDGGQAAAIAAAWGESRADIVAWLNSDDVYLPGAVSRAVDHLLSHPEAAMVYGRAWYIDSGGSRTGSYPTRAFDAAVFRNDCFVCQPASFVRREVFRHLALPDPKLRYCMDYDLWIRLSREFELSYLEQYLASARVHPDAKSSKERGAVYREILSVTRKQFGVAPRDWLIGSILHRTGTGVERWLPFLPVPVRRLLAARLAIFLERRALSTLHADGWTGRRSVVEVRAGAEGLVRLRADSPFWPYARPLRITVEHGRSVLARHRCADRGEFELEFDLTGRFAGKSAVEVVLRANRTFVPWVAGWVPNDPRPVSFRVLENCSG